MCALSYGTFNGYTKEEIILFVTISYTIYIECIMALETFHLAGVASTSNVNTSVIACQSEMKDNEEIACDYIECELNLFNVYNLHLSYLINKSRTMLPKTEDYLILISYIGIAIKYYNLIRIQQIFGIILNYLMHNLQNIQIKEIENVSRALIHQKKIRNHYLEQHNRIEATKKSIENISNTNECQPNPTAIDRQWRILTKKHCCDVLSIGELFISVVVNNGMWFIYLDSIQIYLYHYK